MFNDRVTFGPLYISERPALGIDARWRWTIYIDLINWTLQIDLREPKNPGRYWGFKQSGR